MWQRQRLFDSVTTVMYDCFHPSTHPKLIIIQQIRVTYLYISLCPIQSTSLPVFPESHWLPVWVLILFSFSTSTPDCLFCHLLYFTVYVPIVRLSFLVVTTRWSTLLLFTLLNPLDSSTHHRVIPGVIKRVIHTNLLLN